MDKDVANKYSLTNIVIKAFLAVFVGACLTLYFSEKSVSTHAGKTYFYGTLKPSKGRTTSYAIIETSGYLDGKKIIMPISEYKKISGKYQCIELDVYLITKENDNDYRLKKYEFSKFVDLAKAQCIEI